MISATNSAMRIRKLQRKDVRAAAAIVQLNYSATFARSAMRELHEMFGTAAVKPLYFVAEDEAMIVGLAGCMQSWMDYDVYTIFWVNVHPERQREGIGRQLVAKVLVTLKKKNPAMILLTTTVPQFYRRHFGFETVAPLRNGYCLMTLASP